MARLIYVAAALAAASLVAGFLIRTSNIPLFVSIGLSAVITVLILGGWSRRLRQGGFGDVDEEPELDDLVVEVDEIEPIGAEPVEAASARPTLTRELARRTRSRPDVTTRSRPDETTRLPSARTDERAKAKPKRSRRGRRSTPEAPEIEIETVAPRSRPKVAKGRPRADETTPQRAAKAAPRAPSRRRPRPDETTPQRAAATSKPSRRTAATSKRKPARGGAGGRTAAAASEPSTRGGRVVVIPGRSRYHRPGCRFAKGDDVREVGEATAKRRGYEPCNVCKP